MHRFHHRVHLVNPQLPLGSDTELVLEEGSDGRVSLRGVEEDAQLGETTKIRLRGLGFATEAAARAAGDRWRTVLERTFAAVGIAADFGDRAMTGAFTRAGLDAMVKASGWPVLNDRHALLIFEDGERTPILSYTGSASGFASPQRSTLLRALSAPAAAEPLSQEQRLAFDLYSASFRSDLADARFLLLMMAVETMSVQQPRSAAARELIERFLAATGESSLDDQERRSLEGSLKHLAVESVNQAGRRLAATLGGREYAGHPAGKFFTRCYALRSELVHGTVPRPAQQDVGQLAAPLQTFVGDLIAGPDLLRVVASAPDP